MGKTRQQQRNLRKSTNCRGCSIAATTKQAHAQHPSNKIVGKVQKCVVKVKRLKMQPNDFITASQRLRPLLGKPASDALGNDVDVSIFEPGIGRNSTMVVAQKPPPPLGISPCKVRLKRIDNTSLHQKSQRFFHRDQPPTRSRSSVTRNVYEFLSQSQIDDDKEREDPAGDIVKKMLKEGRACAMMRTRTAGKFRAKPVKKKIRPVGKRKQCSLQKLPAETTAVPQALSPIYEPENDSSSDDEPANLEPIEVPVQVHAPSPNKYSSLARSVLLNQTKTNNAPPSVEMRRELLNMARKFVSTPLNRKSATVSRANATALSPIPRQSAGASPRAGGSSPWRVPDESPLPNTFVFGFNTSQLPSYSSDHIRKHVYVPDDYPEPPPEESVCPPLLEPSSDSAVNDSNGENLPPSTIAASARSENVENFVHLPNPRRTLQHRTPFKDINILDVVNLPSWKNKTTPIKELNLFETSKEFSPRHSRNLFGFEEILNENEPSETSNDVALSQNVTLHEKLQRLKRLRPNDRELPQVSTAPMRHAYDDLEAMQPKQCNIREMLCSTMIAQQPATPLAANDSAGLFRDDEPDLQTTFDKTKPRHTYVKEQPKRKRKQRVRVLFIDTDSESENDEQDSVDKSADSPGKAPPQKRTRKDAEHEAKLKKYITSFNKECEEVSKFPLIIE